MPFGSIVKSELIRLDAAETRTDRYVKLFFSVEFCYRDAMIFNYPVRPPPIVNQPPDEKWIKSRAAFEEYLEKAR